MNFDEKVAEVFETHLGVTPGEIVDGAILADDLGADSLDEVILIMAFEEAFDVEISDDAAKSIKTVADVKTFLHTLLKHPPEVCSVCGGSGIAVTKS